MYGDRMANTVVIGGGLAGAMTAIRLSTPGREVVLLEKEKDAHHKVCGEFLSPEAVAYLGHAGIDPQQLGARPIRSLSLSVKNRRLETELPFRAWSVSRCALDAAVLGRAEELGCVVRRGVSVQALQPHGAGWQAKLSDGSVQCARTAFLATGKHDLRGWSRRAGVPDDLVGFKMHWRLSPEQTSALRGLMHLFLFSGGYGGLALVEGDSANLCLVVKRARLHQCRGWEALLAGLKIENAHIRERLAGARPLWQRPLAVSAIPYGYMARHCRGIWPVGDQAAVIPSFTGDGMAIALHSGALAAQMFLGGATTAQYLSELRGQLQGAMALSTLLSRAMVSPFASGLVPAVLAVLPRAVGWIARSTRIPDSVLRTESRLL